MTFAVCTVRASRERCTGLQRDERKSHGGFSEWVIANTLLLLLLVVGVVALVVSAGREVIEGRGQVGSEDRGGESLSNSRLERTGSKPAAQPER